jgi:hypothetical protein
MKLYYVETEGNFGVWSGKWYATEKEAYAALDALTALGFHDECTDEHEITAQMREVDGPESLDELVDWLCDNAMVMEDLS